MAKRPAEVFGYPVDVGTAEAIDSRERTWCPFVEELCSKPSRLIDYPMGVCSAEYEGDVVALCPKRFLEKKKVFMDIGDHHFGSRENLVVFQEIGVPGAPHLGRFDHVMVRHEPLGTQIEDFVAVELQTGQTTYTGRLVAALEDFMGGKQVRERTYGFGLNMADIWKRAFTQILTEGIALERWGHKVFWVIQEPVFRDFEHRYQLQGLGYHDSHTTVFVLYDLRRVADRYELAGTRMRSSTVDDLFQAFRTNLDVPPKDDFVKKLQRDLKARIQPRLGLDF